MASAADVYVTHAFDADFDALYSFLFATREENLYFREPDEVRAMLEQRVFVLLRDVETNAILGACYVRGDDAPEETFELGGIYLAESTRGSGLADWMCRAALVNLYATTQHRGLILAHVRVGNPRPRKLLERLGFRDVGRRETYPAQQVPGLAHMTPDADGNVHADLFHFDPAAWRGHVAELINMPRAVRGRAGNSLGLDVVLDVVLESCEPEVLEEMLADFAP